MERLLKAEPLRVEAARGLGAMGHTRPRGGRELRPPGLSAPPQLVAVAVAGAPPAAQEAAPQVPCPPVPVLCGAVRTEVRPPEAAQAGALRPVCARQTRVEEVVYARMAETGKGALAT